MKYVLSVKPTNETIQRLEAILSSSPVTLIQPDQWRINIVEGDLPDGQDEREFQLSTETYQVQITDFAQVSDSHSMATLVLVCACPELTERHRAINDNPEHDWTPVIALSHGYARGRTLLRFINSLHAIFVHKEPPFTFQGESLNAVDYDTHTIGNIRGRDLARH